MDPSHAPAEGKEEWKHVEVDDDCEYADDARRKGEWDLQVPPSFQRLRIRVMAVEDSHWAGSTYEYDGEVEEEVEEEGISSVNPNEPDESVFDEDAVDGNDGIGMGTDQQASLYDSEKDVVIYLAKYNEGGGGKWTHRIRVKRTKRKQQRVQGMLYRIIPKLKREQRWTQEE